jgi:glycosyltransferase involved in cell wall biosynthesis
VLYHGNLSPSLLPGAVVKALTRVPASITLRVVGYETVGFAGYAQELIKMAQRLRVQDRIELIPAKPRHQLLKLVAECDVGLVLMPVRTAEVNLRWIVGASNKAFDYLTQGLALLVSDRRDWRETYLDPGYGLACQPDDAESIATALRWFLEHPEQMRAMGEAGRARILADWNYEKQFAPVLQRLQRTWSGDSLSGALKLRRDVFPGTCIGSARTGTLPSGG